MQNCSQISLSFWVSFFLENCSNSHGNRGPTLGIIVLSFFTLSPSAVTHTYILLICLLFLVRSLLPTHCCLFSKPHLTSTFTDSNTRIPSVSPHTSSIFNSSSTVLWGLSNLKYKFCHFTQWLEIFQYLSVTCRIKSKPTGSWLSIIRQAATYHTLPVAVTPCILHFNHDVFLSASGSLIGTSIRIASSFQNCILLFFPISTPNWEHLQLRCFFKINFVWSFLGFLPTKCNHFFIAPPLISLHNYIFSKEKFFAFLYWTELL